jgi:hypothetical protein
LVHFNTGSVQKAPVLGLQLREALSRIGSKLVLQQSVEGELGFVLDGLNLLPAQAVVRAEREITCAAKLDYHLRQPSRGMFRPRPATTDLDQLKTVPGIEYLFIFHRDGYIREAALHRIGSGLPSPFLFAAIAWRLNDWAAPVRSAAVGCAKRTFPRTEAAIIAQAAMALLSRESAWGRWTTERGLLIETFRRPDVAAALADIIEKTQAGTVASVLQRALQESGIDPFLEDLAEKAAQPAVRAIALQALIDGYAQWPSGFAWQWIDKSMGLRRRVRILRQRPLTTCVSRRATIITGVADRSVAVKKIALDALTRYRAEIPDARDIAEPLSRFSP